ncbi:MAG: YheU family protein [Desulfosarcina sp.]|nr:YheU family protein [Desulfobacterales bacterium]
MPEIILVPFEELSREALQGLLEAYVGREGTDYGHSSFSLVQKVAAVRRQIEKGRAVIVFDPASGSCNIVPRQDLPPDTVVP